jgi:transcription elongation GreA/GreB family factor
MVQQTLMQQKGAAPRAVFAAADSEAAGKLKLLIEQNAGLTSLNRGRLLGLLRLEHERLFAEDSRPWRDEGVIYTTETGLLRRQEDLERIIKFDIPAVAKQIGEAAAFGDLSENSEYTAALEKRDQLTSRAAMMENEIKAARIITPDMARSPYVNVGCRIRARNLDSDREETFCFLGPWDAEPERGVLTYDAPLALAFMGHKVGDEVVYGEGDDRRRWEVMAIEPGL